MKVSFGQYDLEPWLDLPGDARGDGGNVDGLGQSARAVGDGQAGGLGDGVGDISVNNLSCGRAVGDIGSDDLGGVLSSTVGGAVVGGRDTGHEGSGSSEERETHVDGV
jgi:hypothetical protein